MVAQLAGAALPRLPVGNPLCQRRCPAMRWHAACDTSVLSESFGGRVFVSSSQDLIIRPRASSSVARLLAALCGSAASRSHWASTLAAAARVLQPVDCSSPETPLTRVKPYQ